MDKLQKNQDVLNAICPVPGYAASTDHEHVFSPGVR